jgi:hypothetical protein
MPSHEQQMHAAPPPQGHQGADARDCAFCELLLMMSNKWIKTLTPARNM